MDGRGNAYVGNVGFDFPVDEFAPGILALVTPDGSVRQAADGVAFPHGLVVTPRQLDADPRRGLRQQDHRTRIRHRVQGRGIPPAKLRTRLPDKVVWIRRGNCDRARRRRRRPGPPGAWGTTEKGLSATYALAEVAGDSAASGRRASTGPKNTCSRHRKRGRNMDARKTRDRKLVVDGVGDREIVMTRVVAAPATSSSMPGRSRSTWRAGSVRAAGPCLSARSTSPPAAPGATSCAALTAATWA